MKILKQELKIILNILLNYRKYRKIVGSFVCIKTSSKSSYRGEMGYVYSFEFENLKYPIVVRMCSDVNRGKEICCSIKELEKGKSE